MTENELSPVLGTVRSTNDPAQMGRLQVFLPGIDNEKYPDEIPWANYATPFGGVINNISSGPDKENSYGPTGYGFWGIPKEGSIVICFFIVGDPQQRYWTHSVFPTHSNRGLPGGRGYDDNGNEGPFTDSYENLEPGYSNLKEAGLDSGDHYYTKGGYERQVAQSRTTKDGSEGYAENASRPGDLDPQTYCITTPGHHFISLQDSPEFSRIRLKTAKGNQLILDDTNERIYISTARGKTYIEADENGRLYVYSNESISFRTEKDFNVYADGNINMEAGKEVNVNAGTSMYLSADIDINIDAGASIFEEAMSDFNIKAGSNIIESGSEIHLNTMPAAAAKSASSPAIKPAHEPWTRPNGPGTRNKYWRP